jgi:hypothetical protein
MGADQAPIINEFSEISHALFVSSLSAGILSQTKGKRNVWMISAYFWGIWAHFLFSIS